MVERRGLFWALKRLGLIWEGDLPWLNSLVVNKAKSKKTKEIPWPSIRQRETHPGGYDGATDAGLPSWSATKVTRGCGSCRCWGQFVALFFGQLTGQHSLRDLVTTLDAGRKKLQQVGRGAVSRSPLADANRKRPQEIFGELFGCLYQRCRRQAPGQRFAFRHRVYSLDATVIDLCLKVFDWAKFRKRKGAIKLHLILDHAGHIPSFCVMTPGREHAVALRYTDGTFSTVPAWPILNLRNNLRSCGGYQ